MLEDQLLPDPVLSVAFLGSVPQGSFGPDTLNYMNGLPDRTI